MYYYSLKNINKNSKVYELSKYLGEFYSEQTIEEYTSMFNNFKKMRLEITFFSHTMIHSKYSEAVCIISRNKVVEEFQGTNFFDEDVFYKIMKNASLDLIDSQSIHGIRDTVEDLQKYSRIFKTVISFSPYIPNKKSIFSIFGL